MIWLIECECPKGHRIAGMPVEVDDGLTIEAKREQAQLFYIEMQAGLTADIERGKLAPSCPRCGAPHDRWKFTTREAKDGVSLDELINQVAKASKPDPTIIEMVEVRPKRKQKPKDTIH